MDAQRLLPETDEQDFLNAGIRAENCLNLADGDAGGSVHREAEGASADRRERDARQAVLGRELERIAIARREQVVLLAVLVPPDRTDRVNDMARFEVVAPG